MFRRAMIVFVAGCLALPLIGQASSAAPVDTRAEIYYRITLERPIDGQTYVWDIRNGNFQAGQDIIGWPTGAVPGDNQIWQLPNFDQGGSFTTRAVARRDDRLTGYPLCAEDDNLYDMYVRNCSQRNDQMWTFRRRGVGGVYEVVAHDKYGNRTDECVTFVGGGRTLRVLRCNNQDARQEWVLSPRWVN